MKKYAFGIIIVFMLCVYGGKDIVHNFAGKVFFPGLSYLNVYEKETNWSETLAQSLFPLYRYYNENKPVTPEVEDKLTYEMIMAWQANDEEKISEDLLEQPKTEETTQPVSTDISIEKLKDFNYLVSKFYTVDSTTSITESQLNVEDLLSRDMHIDKTTSGPKVLIFHTHSQEGFVDSGTTIVGMGAYLAKLLNEKGIETIHHDGVYDLIDGKLDRSNAYQMASVAVSDILNQYPSIEVVIDLHRDGVPETTHLVKEVDGKKVAKIMFFNGLSRTKTNGNLSSLPNPYIQDNLSFSFQMQMASESLYPGLARRIYLKGYRYNLHLMPKSLLIEAGAQTNTVEEVKNAMELLANILCKVLL